MERIKINEVDNTISASNTDDTEVVYVPGFAWTGSDGQDEIASKYRVPVLCTTLGEFEMNFGTTAPRFKTNQMYKAFSPASTDGFSGSALPNTYQTIPWFAGETEVFDDANAKTTFILGDADPSYTYAKELISKGIAVVYERMNKSAVYPKNISIWKASKAYEINDKVVATFDGDEHYFICKIAHTSESTFDATERTKWEIFKGFEVYSEQSKGNYKVGDVLFVPDSGESGGAYKKVVSNVESVTHTIAESAFNKDHEGGYVRGNVVIISDGEEGTNNIRKAVCTNAVTAGTEFSRDNFAFQTSPFEIPQTWVSENRYNVNDVVSRTLTQSDLDALALFDSDNVYIFGDFVKYDNEYYVCIAERTVKSEDFDISKFSPVVANQYVMNFRCVQSSTGDDPWDEYITAPNNGSDVHWITNFFSMEVRSSESKAFTDANLYYWVVDPTSQGNDKSYFKCHLDNNITFETLTIQPEEIPIYDVNVETFYKNVGGTTEDGLDPTYSCVFDAANGTLLDASRFNIKYFTTGAYPNFEYTYAKSNAKLANKMAQFAAIRGDAIAMIDHTDKPERPLVGTNSVYEVISGNEGIPSEFATFATMVTPWASYRSTNTLGEAGLLMPGSYGYFDALANAKKYYTTWLPVAGTTRGVVTNLIATHTDRILTNTIADNYQIDPNRTGVSINAITYINNYGYCVWGNRTLMNLTSDSKGFAALFLNLRNVMSDIKKQAFATAQRYMFEQVDVQLWIKFKYMMSSLLDRMKDYGVVADYQFIQNKVTDKTKLSCTIKVWPVYSVESFEIGIVLTDEDVNVE